MKAGSRNKVIIIGGGASGLMAGITAARLGASVVVLEHMDRVGKKLLATGNGRCNYTNLDQKPEYYRSGCPDFPGPVLAQFPAAATVDFFRELGIYPKNRNGYLYPNSDQAVSVLEVLMMEAARLGLTIIKQAKVKAVRKKRSGEWAVVYRHEQQEKQIAGNTVVLAAGSKAAPVTGSDGSGYQLAQALGHRLIEPLPALVQLRCKEKFFKQLAGIRVESRVSLSVAGTLAAADTGEIQLTDYGISGIPVFQVSRYASMGIHQNAAVKADLDFLPALPYDDTVRLLTERQQQGGHKSGAEFMTGLFHQKLGVILLQEAGIAPGTKAKAFTSGELKRLAGVIKKFTVTVKAANPFTNAQICCGGVMVSEVDPQTLESKKAKGIFLAGEILDVDGICGGYNLQWAWSSGYVAGKHAASMK